MKEVIKEVYEMLKNREIHPSGTFDKMKRFYATHSDLIDVREPSAKWPFSHMTACRTLKYVKKVSEKFDCKTREELLKKI